MVQILAAEVVDEVAVGGDDFAVYGSWDALIALAVGAVLAGFVGIPAALGGGNAIEKFLEDGRARKLADSTLGARYLGGALNAASTSAIKTIVVK